MAISRSFLTLAAACLSLTACGDVREDLGLGRNSPDEFAVIDRPPLSIPPDFNLRPPRPGAPRPQDLAPEDQAKAALLGTDSATATGDQPSDGEKALLSAAKTDRADPNIRHQIDNEAAQKTTASPHLVEQLLKNDSKDDATVNAPAEAARIDRDQSSGQPVNAGATPVIEKQDSGWLGL